MSGFAGGLLGATVVQQINNAIYSPSSIPSLIGAALPSASNFFIGYVALRALFLTPLRLLIPYPAMAFHWLR